MNDLALNRADNGTLTRWNTGRSVAEQISNAQHSMLVARLEIARLEKRIAEERRFINAMRARLSAARHVR